MTEDEYEELLDRIKFDLYKELLTLKLLHTE